MSPIDPLIAAFLASGVAVGFGHCIGMCGPVVVCLSLNLPRQRLLPCHLLYHCGRIVTYVLMGGAAGAVGSFVQVAGSMAGVQKAAMIATGLMMVVMGAAMTGWVPAPAVFKQGRGLAARTFARLSKLNSTGVYFPIGLALGLLPCGPVYTALLAAAGAGMQAGHPLAAATKGMAVMAAFGIGTVPALLVVAKAASIAWLRWRTAIYRVGAFLVIVSGIYIVAQGFRL